MASGKRGRRVMPPPPALIAERQVWYGISNAISPRHRWTTFIVSGVHEHPFLPVPFES
jgi:hypothetical protein